MDKPSAAPAVKPHDGRMLHPGCCDLAVAPTHPRRWPPPHLVRANEAVAILVKHLEGLQQLRLAVGVLRAGRVSTCSSAIGVPQVTAPHWPPDTRS